ncbi:MAG: hypothetical protein OQJ81_03685 [Melioribacteraceae bacterium]|nr:hypothetical protein [Melioribacteraceae bacterium]
MKKLLAIIFAILFSAFLFFFWGGAIFTEYSVNNTVTSIRDSINFSDKKLFTYSDLEDQPELVKRFFRSVLSDSIYIPKFITVEQSAQFKTDVNSEWRELKATQYFSTDRANFIWVSEMKTSKFFWVNAIDSYINGKGNMLIKLNSSITVADSWGIELDKSGLFRYISEAVFFPTKLFPTKNLLWNILDSNLAEVKFTDSKNSIVAKLYFDSDYKITKVETYDKYRALEEGFKKSLYTVYFSDYEIINDHFRVPKKVEVEWDLPSGKFIYGKFNIDKITYE